MPREYDTCAKENCARTIDKRLNELCLNTKEKQSVSFSKDLTRVKYFDTKQPSRCLYEYECPDPMRELRLLNFTFGPVIQRLYAHASFFRGTMSLKNSLLYFEEQSSISLRYTLDMKKNWAEHIVSDSLSFNKIIIDFFIPWTLPHILESANIQLEFQFLIKCPSQQHHYCIDNHGENFVLFVTETNRVAYTSDSGSESSLTSIEERDIEE